MRFTDGFRLAELASGAEGADGADGARRVRAKLSASLLDAIKASDPEDRTKWLTAIAGQLRRAPTCSDLRANAILGAASGFSPRRRYRPPAGLRQHLTRWLRTQPSSVRAKREIAELEGRWDE